MIEAKLKIKVMGFFMIAYGLAVIQYTELIVESSRLKDELVLLKTTLDVLEHSSSETIIVPDIVTEKIAPGKLAAVVVTPVAIAVLSLGIVIVVEFFLDINLGFF